MATPSRKSNDHSRLSDGQAAQNGVTTPHTGRGRALATPTPQPFVPFPVDALPVTLAALVSEGAAALGCDLSMIAIPALCVVASEIGNTRRIKLKGGWNEPPILWGCVVAESGTLKTPAARNAINPLRDLQERLRLEHAQRVSDYLKEIQEWKDNKKEGHEDIGDEPQKPVEPRIIVGDITVERLCEILEDNPRGLLLFRDELAGWLGSFMRYKSQGAGSDLPHYLQMYNALSVDYDRKTGERRSIYVPQAALSVCGGIQPGVLARALTSDFFDSGLVARLLLTMPPRKPKRWTELEISEDTDRRYAELLTGLLDLKPGPKSTSKKWRPVRCTLSPAAKVLWVAFFDEWGDKQALASGDLASAYSKLEAVAARLALIHHVVSAVECCRADLTEIESASMQAGITLARWFGREAERVYAVLRESADQRLLRELAELVERHGGRITARDLHKASKSRYPTSEAAEAALDSLVSTGHGKWQTVPPGSHGGRPTKLLVLLPRNLPEPSAE